MPAELEVALAKAWMEVLEVVGRALYVIAASSLSVIAICALVGLIGAGRRSRARAAAATRTEAYYKEHCAEAQTPRPRAEDVDFVLQSLFAERVQGAIRGGGLIENDGPPESPRRVVR